MYRIFLPSFCSQNSTVFSQQVNDGCSTLKLHIAKDVLLTAQTIFLSSISLVTLNEFLVSCSFLEPSIDVFFIQEEARQK